MSRRKRRWYTATEKSEMCDRWQRGESLNAIARAFETSHSAITKNFARFGGIHPRGRQRSGLALTLSEREEISRGIVCGLSLRTIARQLDRAHINNSAQSPLIVICSFATRRFLPSMNTSVNSSSGELSFEMLRDCSYCEIFSARDFFSWHS